MVNILSFFTIVSIFSLNIQAAEVIGTFEIPQFVQSSKKGNFINLVKKIEKRSGENFVISVRPSKRVLANFNHQNIIGYFPALDVDERERSYNSSPFYYKKDLFFYRKGENSNIKKAKKICLTRGYPYADFVSKLKGVEIFYSDSDSSCLKMLNLGRVDGFVCEAMSGFSALKKLKLSKITANKKPLSSMKVYFSFVRNKRGKYLADIFTKELKKMRSSGELVKIFETVRKDIRNFSGIDINFLRP